MQRTTNRLMFLLEAQPLPSVPFVECASGKVWPGYVFAYPNLRWQKSMEEGRSPEGCVRVKGTGSALLWLGHSKFSGSRVLLLCSSRTRW